MKKIALILILVSFSLGIVHAQKIVHKTAADICDCMNAQQSDTIELAELIPQCAKQAFILNKVKLEKQYNGSVDEGTEAYETMTTDVVNAMLDDCEAFAQYVADLNDLSDWKNEVDELIDEGKYGDAYDLATKVLKDDPSNHQAYFKRGYIYYLNDQYYRAVVQYLEAIKLKSDYIQAFNEMARVKSKVGDLEGAYEAVSKALEIDSTYAEAFNTLGMLYYKVEDYQSAVNSFRKAVYFDEETDIFQYNLGVSLQDIDEYAAAAEVLQDLAQRTPDDESVWFELGNAYYGMDEHLKAIENFEKAAELSPEEAVLYDNMGYAWSQLKDYQKAIENFSRSLALSAGDQEVIFSRGMAYYYTQQYTLAMTDIDEAIAIDSVNYPGFYDYKGKISMATGDYQQAIAAFSHSLELYPNDCEVLRLRAEAYDRIENLDAAAEDRKQMDVLECKEEE